MTAASDSSPWASVVILTIVVVPALLRIGARWWDRRHR